MASKRLTFEEAVEELRNPTPGAMLWSWAYDSNPDNVEGWTGMTGNTEPDELDAQHGPFILTTHGETELLDYTVLTEEEIAQIKSDLAEYFTTCPADGEEYDRAYDLNHELHDSEHPNHHKYCNVGSAGHWHEGTTGDLDEWSREGNEQAWLESVRFDPAGAYDRLNSFISIFENDGMTDTITLNEALKVISELVDKENDRLSHP